MLQIIHKFKILLSRKQKLRVLIIGVMMVIGALLETLGVGLILPLVTAITTPDFIHTNKIANFICGWFGITTEKSFWLLVIGTLIFVYIFKNIYLFFEYYVQYRFICNNRFLIQQELMEVYLYRPYEFFLNAESGEIVRVITTDVKNTFDLLGTVLAFFTEGVISVALIATIFIIDPFMVGLLAVVLGGIMLIVVKLLKPALKRAGVKYQKNAGMMNKWLLQSVSGIKEVKIARKEEYFLQQFSKYGRKAVDSEKLDKVFGTIPRLCIEAFGMSAMLLVIGVLICLGRDMNTMIPQLSVFAMAAVRLLPSVNRMSTSLNSMAYQEPALDKMLEHLSVADRWKENQRVDMYSSRISEGNHEEEIHLENKVELADITYTYPNTDSPVLYHANMEIPVGKSIGIVGASGSGKTTTVDLMLGLLSLQEGHVLVDGVDIQQDYEGWLQHIGYIPQMIFMLDDTIRANVAFGIPVADIDDQQIWRVLEEAQLKEFVQSLPDGLDTTIGERGVRLSGGQRQRIGIARALYPNPELLIFDEATSALDNETEAAIMESINALHGKKTLVIIAHRLTTIQECDMVYRVRDGKIQKER